ncbi:MAG: hypothetical protein KGH93_02045 [Patescibacteria group bacterium]|nr:hypothetical protein [Patescibacteria group bacterium]MDE1945960.1 hypothetical protein [Patescibacteria group bacterium]
MQNNFEKGIEDIRKTGLSKIEKSMMLENVFAANIPSPYAPARNIFGMPKTFASVLASVLALVTVSGSVAYAAEGSVPGDLLYPVKTHVTEPIRDALAFTPAEKASWDAQKASRRLAEAETLANRGALSPTNEQDLRRHFDESAAAFDHAIGSMATTDPARAQISDSFANILGDQENRFAAIGRRASTSMPVRALGEDVARVFKEVPRQGEKQDMENPEASSSMPAPNHGDGSIGRFPEHDATSARPDEQAREEPPENEAGWQFDRND